MKDEFKIRGFVLAILTISMIVGATIVTQSATAFERIDDEYPTAAPVDGEILPTNQFSIISQWLGLILMASVIVGVLAFLAKKPIFKNY